MMANFYVFNNKYGVDSRDIDNERVGTVLVFSSRAARDEWVNNDSSSSDGRHRAEAITAKEARREMIRAAYDDMLNADIVGDRSDLKYLPMLTIIRAYTRSTM